MPFQTLSSDGLSITCFLVEHDWQTAFTVSHFFPVDIAEGLSARENRAPQAEAMLLSVGLQIWAESDEAQALRQALATVGTAWVGLPLLADSFVGSDYAVAGARVYEAARLIDLTAPAIVDPTAVSLTAGHTYAPLVVGHITQLPQIEPASGTLALCSAVLTEDSPWTFRVGINAAVVATLSAGTWPAALSPDWSSPPTQTPIAGLKFDRIGQQREQTIADQESALRWTCDAGFSLCDKTELATLLGFFLLSRGPWSPFAAPLWYTPGTPTAEAPHATTVRFTDPTLRIEFTTTALASAQVGFTQVPWEIVGTAGETPAQPARIFLYQITYDVPSPVIWRFTNGWRPLTRSGDGTYNPAPIEHDAINSGLDLSSEDTTLNSFLFGSGPADNPLYLFNPDQLEGRLLLRIYEIATDPIAPDSATLVWSGSITDAPQTGRKFAAKGKWLAGLLDREFPAVRIGPICSTYFLSSRCGHLKSTWAKTGALATSSGSVITLTCSDSAAANTYAPGKIEVGSGLTYESRRITASTPVAGGQQLTLDRALRQSVTGQTVTYLRTCDQTKATCQALDPTGWKARFRGDPNIPVVNLSLPTSNATPATKKG